jgi:hypothetical protein
MKDKIKELLAPIVGGIILIILVWLIAIILCIFAIFIIWVSANSNADKFDATYRTWDNVKSIELFSVIEGWFMVPLRQTFDAFQKGVIFSSEFRFVLILIVVLEVCTMGLALLIGHDKLTVKDIGIDILITFGGAAILLSPNVMEYLNFCYGLITGAESWALGIARNAILQMMQSSYYIDVSSNPTYAVMDMIAGTFFDPVIAKRVQTKMIGLLFAGYVHFVPVLAIVLFYCVLATFSVFLAILSAKLIVFFTLQLIPFFLLFSALNDAKVKVSKDLKAKGQSFLWTAIDVGIIQPSLFIIMISLVSNFLLYAFILSPLNDILTFTVYIHTENQWLESLTWIPIFGGFLELFIKKYPKAIGVNHDLLFQKIFFMIIGLIFFKNMFPMVCEMVKAVCIAAGGAVAGAFTKNGGVFSAKNSVTGAVEQLGDAPVEAGKYVSTKLGNKIMGVKDKDEKSGGGLGGKGNGKDDGNEDGKDDKDTNKDNMPDYDNDDDGDGSPGN